ncbi:hypothetical protein FSPOR_8234 [Fusarium sporotrichioides]|uniref:Uncharacterized protein n=1 Tax=Fusarium sporotrichioides TaxID=5514 RepID=A0A395RV56_FUSSP|nr:hypothetical protein FSPOR_8234 [Fusarium sporotrichioides]
MENADGAATNQTPKLTTRVAYIRTFLDRKSTEEHTEADRANLDTWLWMWVGQNVPWDPCGSGRKNRTTPPPDLRHHYILGHSTGADPFILDWLMRYSESRYARLSRSDFTVYLSATQMNNLSTKDLLQRLASENVTVKKITAPSEQYTSDDICDSVMLSESDYILDPTLQLGPDGWISTDALYRDSLRHGHPQRYKTEELSTFYYENRLKNKMGHTMTSCSYPHGKSEQWKRDHEIEWRNYKCPSCGQRCKRSKGCKTTGEDWATDKDKHKDAWMEGLDLSAPRSPDFERYWRTFSVNDVVYYCGESFKKWNWRSVDTFSGDWKGE